MSIDAAQRLTATVIGAVQGVGFRWWVRVQATELRLTGWVQNDPEERSVSLVAEGEVGALDELERRLWIGPRSARVDRIDARRGPASGGYARFEITR